MLEIFYAVAWREAVKLWDGELGSQRKNALIVVLVIVLIANLLMNWMVSRPDCLSYPERKAGIVSTIQPACSDGFCDDEQYRQLISDVMDDTLTCERYTSDDSRKSKINPYVEQAIDELV